MRTATRACTLKRACLSTFASDTLTAMHEENPVFSTVPVVQVRVLLDHGDMMSKEGKIVLKKDTVHLLPLDEVEHLMRAGIVEYLHVGMTM